MTFPGEYAETPLPEAAFSLTCKSGKGYDADMLTVRGQSYDEFKENAEAVLGFDTFAGKLNQLRQVPQDATGAPAQSSPAPQSTPAAPAPQAQPQGQAAPANSGDWKAQAPFCAHGQRVPREWTAKSGRNAGQTQYTYFCPQPREVPREQKCAPVDAITGKEWG